MGWQGIYYLLWGNFHLNVTREDDLSHYDCHDVNPEWGPHADLATARLSAEACARYSKRTGWPAERLNALDSR